MIYFLNQLALKKIATQLTNTIASLYKGPGVVTYLYVVLFDIHAYLRPGSRDARCYASLLEETVRIGAML